MADNTNTAQAGPEPATADAEPQAGTPAGQEQATPNANAANKKTTFDAEYVERLRAEAAENRVARKKAEDALKAIEDDKLRAQGEWQKLAAQKEQEAQEARDALRVATMRAEVALLAAQHRVSKPHVLLKLVKDDVEYDDAGSPRNLADLVDAALKDMPELVERPSAQGAGAGTGGARTNAGKQADTKELPTFQNRRGLGDSSLWKP